MKKSMLAILAGSCALLVGCTTPQAVYVAPTVQPMPEAETPARATSQAAADFVVVDEVSLKLRAAIFTGTAEQAFNQKLAQRLKTSLTDAVEFVGQEANDVKVVLNSEFELKDSDGEFRRIRCVQVVASVYYLNRQVATKVIEPKEMPRKAGEQNAKDQYLNVVAQQIAPFLQQEMLKVSNTELAVSKLSFALAKDAGDSNTVNVAAQVNRIKKQLGKMDGVVNYAITTQDVKNASCTVRVVYQKRNYPQGIANALNYALANQ